MPKKSESDKKADKQIREMGRALRKDIDSEPMTKTDPAEIRKEHDKRQGK